jgi:thiol-disulfide isomerase/thioredoxin
MRSRLHNLLGILAGLSIFCPAATSQADPAYDKIVAAIAQYHQLHTIHCRVRTLESFPQAAMQDVWETEEYWADDKGRYRILELPDDRKKMRGMTEDVRWNGQLFQRLDVQGRTLFTSHHDRLGPFASEPIFLIPFFFLHGGAENGYHPVTLESLFSDETLKRLKDLHSPDPGGAVAEFPGGEWFGSKDTSCRLHFEASPALVPIKIERLYSNGHLGLEIGIAYQTVASAAGPIDLPKSVKEVGYDPDGNITAQATTTVNLLEIDQPIGDDIFTMTDPRARNVIDMDAPPPAPMAKLPKSSNLPPGPFVADYLSQPLPRYQLQVGQQLAFHMARIRAGEQMTEHLHTDWKIDVTGKNADGSWRIVALVDSGGTFQEGSASGRVERVVEATDGDLYPDGRIVGSDDPLVDLPRLFPRLPADSNQISSGWDEQTDDHSRWTHSASVPSMMPDEVFTFTAAALGGILGVFEPGSRQSYEFDRQSGAIDRAEISSTTPGAKDADQGELRRTAIRQLDSSATTQIAAAASAYDQAVKNYQDAVANSAPLDSLRDQVDQCSKVLLADLCSDAGPDKPDLSDAASAMAPDSPSNTDILNQPAPDWTASGIDGVSHSLTDFRGKVVVLDFGSRDCPWCVREMPQLVRLSQLYKNRPVAVVGMDCDSDPNDARFLTHAMQTPYLTVLAADIASKYPLPASPTVVIIDQNGIMRRRMVGYTALGFEELQSAIDPLLGSSGASPPGQQ